MADSTSLDYDAILSTTLYNYATTLENNVFQARPMLNWLKSKNRIKTYSGGARIVTPLLEGANSTAGVFGLYDTLDINAQDGMTAAEYLWKQAAVSVAIAGLEEQQNNGKEAVIDLLQAKVMQAEESLADLFTTQFLASGAGGDDWNGLTTLIDDTEVCGGLDPDSHSTWKSYKNDLNGALTISAMSAAWNGTAQGGSDTPDFILTSQELWEKYESLLQPQLRYSDPATADAGFVNLLYRGAPVVFDFAVDNGDVLPENEYDEGVVYFLNSKHVWIARGSQKWFSSTPFIRPTNQDARYAQIICYGNLVTNCRRRLGKIVGATA